MSKIIISYVLSTLAGVADVSPRDVETSMLNGMITLRNVALRPTFVPGVLFDTATVDTLEVRLPLLTSDAPIVAHATGTTLVLPLDLAGPPSERSFTDVQAAITPTAILGYNPGDTEEADVELVGAEQAAVTRTGSSPKNSRQEDNDNDEAPRSLSGSFVSRGQQTDTDEDDLLSCNSLSERNELESSVGDSDVEDEPDQGFFARWRTRAINTIGKRWRHATRIELEHAKIVLPCDTRTGLSYEAHVDSFVVTIEPQETLENEQLSVHRLELRGIRVLARIDGANEPRVVDVDSLDVTITSVYHPKSGRLLRKNTVISLDGTCAVVADEDTLFALLKCQMTRDIMMRLPDYCRPFASMRRDRSLWKYAGCCVIKQIQDRKHRFNFTLAHLRFFGDSRRRYLELLDACHRVRGVEAHRQELAEAEQDLRYLDVIHFLRQHVRDKYGLPPLVASPVRPVPRASPTTSSSPPPAFSSRPPITSVHVGLSLVRVQLPARQAILVSGVSLITRDGEQLVRVGNVALVDGDHTQSFAKDEATPAAAPDGSDTRPVPALLSIERHTAEGFANTRVVVAETAVSLRMSRILAVAKPLLETAVQIGLRERFPQAATSADATVVDPSDTPVEPSSVTQTFIVAVPRLRCRLDDQVLLVDRWSATVVMPPEGTPQFGCTLRELSVQTLSDKTYVLSPVVVSAAVGDESGMLVSDIDILIRRPLWAYWRNAVAQLPAIPTSLACAANSSAAPTTNQRGTVSSATHRGATVTHEMLQKVKAVQQWPTEGERSLAKLARINVVFEPLSAKISITRLEVAKRHKLHGSPASGCLSVSVARIGVTCRDETSSLCLKVELGAGLTVSLLSEGRVLACVPEIRVAYTLPPALPSSPAPVPFARPVEATLLSVSTVCVCLVGNTVGGEVARVLVADAVELVSLRGMRVGDPDSIASGLGPYRAAFVQIDASLQRVTLAPLLRLDVDALLALGRDLLTFALDELIPNWVYEDFLCGMNDMAIRLAADECPVELVPPDSASEAGGSGVVMKFSLLPSCTRCALPLSTDSDRGEEGSLPVARKSAGVRTPLMPAPPPPPPRSGCTPCTSPPPSLATHARRLDLGDFGPPLFLSSDPLVVARADIRRHAYFFDIDTLTVALTYPEENTTVDLCAHRIAVEMLMAPMDFWSEESRRKLSAQSGLYAGQLRATLRTDGVDLFDGTLDELDLSYGPRCVVSAAAKQLATSGMSSYAADDRASYAASPLSAGRSPSVMSEMSSFAAPSPPAATSSPGKNVDQPPLATNDGPVTTAPTFHLSKWAARANLCQPSERYERVIRAAATLCADVPETVARALAAKHFVLTSSCHDQTFDLDRLGPFFIDNSSDLLVVEGCTFIALKPSAKCVVVTSGSSVFFKRCVFPCSTADLTTFVRATDAASVFVCDDACQFAADMVLTKEEEGGCLPTSPQDVRRPRAQRRWRRFPMEIMYGQCTVSLPGERVFEVTQPRPVRALYTRGSRPTSGWSLSARSVPCAVSYRSASREGEAMSIAVCPSAVLDVDVRTTSRRRSLAVTAGLTVDEVCLPLDSAPHAALSCLLAAAARVKAARARQPWCADSPRWFVVPPAPEAPSPAAAPPVTQPAPLVWDQWKLLLSVSLIPVRVCLPNPTMTVAKLTLSNAFLWSVREAGHTSAAVEGRFAVTDVLLRDLDAARLLPVLQTSTFVDIQGACTVPRLTATRDDVITADCGHAPTMATTASPPPSPPHKISLVVRLPHTELAVNTGQLRLLSTLAQRGVGSCDVVPAGSPGPNLFPPPGTVVQSFLGVSSIRLRTALGEILTMEDNRDTKPAGAATLLLLPPRQALDMPNGIVEVDQVAVVRAMALSIAPPSASEANLSSRRTETTDDAVAAALAWSIPVLHSRHYGLALSDGRRLLCSATLLTNGTTWVTLRSLIVVCNHSPAPVCFRSDFSAPWTLQSGLVGSLPLRLADTIGHLSVCLGHGGVAASLQEVLWDGQSPSALQAAWVQPSRWLSSHQDMPSADISLQEKEFVSLLDGSSVFLRLSTSRVTGTACSESGCNGSWSFLQLDIRPSAPSLRNATHMPLELEVLRQSSSTAAAAPLRAVVAPGETFALPNLSAEAVATSCRYRLSLEVRPGVWVSTAENDADAKWMYARQSVRFFLPHRTVAEPGGDAGAPRGLPFFFEASIREETGGCALSTDNLVRLVNLTDVPLLAVSDRACAPLAALTSHVEEGQSPQAGYVPKHEPLYLQRVGTTPISEDFELGEPGTSSRSSGAFVSLGEADKADTEGAPGAQRGFLVRRAATDGADFVLQPPTWLVNRTAQPLDFVWKVDGSPQTISLTVPPGGRVPFCWLPVSGRTSYFRFQPVTSSQDAIPVPPTGPSSDMSSPRIPGEWNPGARQSFVVHCCQSRVFFPVEVRKARFCDAAVVAVYPPCQPPLRIVNCTGTSFKDVPAAGVRLVNRSIRPGDSLQLTPTNNPAAPLWVSLDETEVDGVVHGDEGVALCWRRTTHEEETSSGVHRTVVVVVLQTMSATFPRGGGAPPRTSCGIPAAPSTLAWVRAHYGVDVSLTLQRVSLTVTHGDAFTVRAAMDSARVWADVAPGANGGLIAVQCTVEGVQVQNVVSLGGDPVASSLVLAPMGFNLSVRDAAFDAVKRQLDVESIQVQLRPVELTLSDVFLYTVQQVITRSRATAVDANGVTCPRTSFVVDDELDAAFGTLLKAPPTVSVLFKATTVSSVQLEISYDRSVAPPDDYSLLRDVPFLAMLPSLYHARVALDTRVFRNLGGPSIQRTAAPVIDSYVNDALRQLPSTIRSVGFFRSTSFLQAAASKLAGLFSAKPGGTSVLPPPDGSALL